MKGVVDSTASSSEHLTGYSAAEQDLACGQEEPCEIVPRHVCRNAEKNGDHQKFYEQFGKCLQLGIHEDSSNRTMIAALFKSKTSKSGDEQISLKEYVDRMKEGQNVMYYITVESIAVVSSSLFLENLGKNRLEVPPMVDPRG